jgi:outer membrane usher protein FimD/PapC
MGKAVIPDLGLYKPRSINYDVDDLPIGYSLDEGAFFVKPPRGAGYRFTVGSDAVITVVGVLLDESSGEPLSLLSGSAQSESDPEKSPIVFFTNRAGKFALSGVASGKYRIELNDEPKRQFTVVIPDDSPTWYRPGKINVP